MNISEKEDKPVSHVDSGIRRILNSNYVYRFYQWLVRKKNTNRDFILNYVQPKEDVKVLDIGCGTGTFIQFYPNSVEYDGYDMNPDYIEFAKKKYGHRGNFFCKAVDDKLIFEDKRYDIITANALLHHLSDEDADKLFSTSSKILNPNGFLITLDPVYLENQNPISKKIISMDRGQAIRSAEEINSLASKYFSKIETFIEQDYFIFPYDLIITKYYI